MTYVFSLLYTFSRSVIEALLASKLFDYRDGVLCASLCKHGWMDERNESCKQAMISFYVHLMDGQRVVWVFYLDSYRIAGRFNIKPELRIKSEKVAE